MTSNQGIKHLKAEGLDKNYFDMENLLTRSLYRVMNNTNKVPSEVGSFPAEKIDKNMHLNRLPHFAIARPNNHKIGDSDPVDMELQLKLLAQEVCSRVERRYERKLDNVRERDRREAERRLSSIRAEFEAKYKMQIGKLEKEKNRLMDQMAERERTIENRMELRLAEKEDEIESKRRMIDNRLSELLINKENFDKMKEEWNRKIESEMEQLKLEKEKIAMNVIEVSARQKTEMVAEHEMRMWKKRAQDLESEANETRRRIAELMTENFRLNDKIGNVDHLKQELSITLTSLNETREELTMTKVENRRMGDFDRLKMENEQLRTEIERLRFQNSKNVQNAVEEMENEFSLKEEKLKRILATARSNVDIMTNKCRELEMERDVLKQEMKSMQKLIGKGSFLMKNSKEKRLKNRRNKRSSSPDELSSSSSLSEGEMEILNIRQRIQNLDEIAKDLDASVEHFSIANNTNSSKIFEYEDSKVELYDDFCRALHDPNDSVLGVVQKTSSPQKPEKSENDWLKKSRRVVSPPTKQFLEEKNDTPKRKEEKIEEIKEERKEEEKAVVKPEISEFEKKMQARNKIDKRSQILQLASENAEDEKKASTSTSTSVDNPMFANVDPVMADYMKKIMGNREKEKIEEKNEKIEKKKEVEVTLAEELDLEAETRESERNADDWW